MDYNNYFKTHIYTHMWIPNISCVINDLINWIP